MKSQNVQDTFSAMDRSTIVRESFRKHLVAEICCFTEHRDQVPRVILATVRDILRRRGISRHTPYMCLYILANLYSLSLPLLTFSTARNASCGISTRPTRFIRRLPSFCFSSSFRLREISPP